MAAGRPDVPTKTLAELEAELVAVEASEDTRGYPDVHTEDYLKDEIARLKGKGPKPAPSYTGNHWNR
jgi:hypothetical protein